MAKRNLIPWYFIAAIFLVILDYFGMLNGIKKPAELVIMPVQKIIYQTITSAKNIGNIYWQYPHLFQLTTEVEKQKRINEELMLRVRELTEENSKLRSQLEAPLLSSFKFIPSQVLGISRFMLLSVGESSGVKAGMAVVSDTVFLGKVVKTTSSRSLVMLPNDPEMKISAKTSRGTIGEVVGQFGGSILMTRILQKEPLFLDDQVITAGSDSLPPNLIIGKISHINSDDTAPYKQAKLTPLLDYQKETTVFIVTSL